MARTVKPVVRTTKTAKVVDTAPARKPRKSVPAIEAKKPLAERVGGHVECAAAAVESAAVTVINTAVGTTVTVGRSLKNFVQGVGRGFTQHRAQRLNAGS